MPEAPSTRSSFPSRFQAIVMAGGQGSRMTSLTDHVPKALLPVANVPLFWYPLNALARSGFTNAVLMVSDRDCATITQKLGNGSLPPLSGLSVEVIPTGDQNEEQEDGGTADALRSYLVSGQAIQDKVENLLIVSGDLVTNIRLEGMLAQHLSTSAVLTCCLTNSVISGPSPGPKERKKYRDFIALTNHQATSDGVDSQPQQLLYLCEEEDYGENQAINAKLFKRFSNVSLTAGLKDVHLYAVKRQKLLGLLEQGDDSLTSLKADVIPLMLEAQYNTEDGTVNSEECFAYIPETESTLLIAQCNTLPLYFETNRAVQQLLESGQFALPCSDGGEKIDYKSLGANVTDSVIGASPDLGKKSTIRKSIVGDNCQVGPNARVDNSLLMYGVKVAAGAQIKNSIICSNVEMGEKAELLMCIVAPGHRVEGRKKYANEVLCEEREVDLYE